MSKVVSLKDQQYLRIKKEQQIRNDLRALIQTRNTLQKCIFGDWLNIGINERIKESGRVLKYGAQIQAMLDSIEVEISELKKKINLSIVP